MSVQSSARTTRSVEPTAHQRRRDEIVASAAGLFVAGGVATVSMDDIAKKVGLAKATVYHYFKTKDEILYAIHEEMFTALLGRTEARAAAGVSPIERLRGVFGDAFELVASHPGYSRVVFEHLRQLSPTYHKMVRSNQARYEQAVQTILEDGIADGSFTDMDAHLTTFALFGMVNWSHQWYSASGQYTPEQLADQFFGFFVNGIATANGKKRIRRS